ncbi:MAG TPA: NAD(P)-binding domain-containing protein [Thermomicrobiales bacterium]|nr:NAD(P)-binding domain-containing protein [Thermomicrobiales bacterium]
MKKALIVGGGSIGAALSRLLEKGKSGTSVVVYDADSKRSTAKGTLAQEAADADAIFLCVPAAVIANVASEINKAGKKNPIVISLTKGIEPTGKKWVNQVLVGAFDDRAAILAGPMLSAELAKDLPTRAVLAGSPAAFDAAAALFKGSPLALEYSDDLAGVSALGVLKNVYSVGLGVADGLELGANYKGQFAALAFLEMRELLARFGGKPETAFSPAGLGDFLATGFSPHSKNRGAGNALAVNGVCELDSEGCRALPFVAGFLGADAARYRIFSAIAAAVSEPAKARELFAGLLAS